MSGGVSQFNFMMLFWIALGIGVVVIIIIFLLKFLGKDSAVTAMERSLKSGNYKKALNAGLKYIIEQPNDFMIKYNIAQAYEGLKDYSNAIFYYEQASVAAVAQQEHDINAQFVMKIANLYNKNSNVKEALGYYKMALERNPNNTKALFEAADILYQMKNYVKAKEYLETLTEMKPDNLRAKFILAKIYYQIGEFNQSASAFKVLIKSLPDTDAMKNQSSLMLADIYSQQRKFDDCVKTLSPLLNVPELFERVLIRIINTYIIAGEYEKAIALADKNMGRASKEAKVQLNYMIANAYFKSGDVHKAIQFWQKTNQLDPTFRDVEIIMKRYKPIIDTPNMEYFFSKSDGVFENFCIKMLRLKFVNGMGKGHNFTAFKTQDAVHIVYRRPFPAAPVDFDEAERVLRQEILGTNAIKIYSLFGVTDETKRHSIYRKIELVAGENLINLIGKG